MIDEKVAAKTTHYKQTDLFSDPDKEIEQEQKAKKRRQKDRQLSETILKLQKKLGNKNAVLRLSDLEKGATARERNQQIGGHKA